MKISLLMKLYKNALTFQYMYI